MALTASPLDGQIFSNLRRRCLVGASSGHCRTGHNEPRAGGDGRTRQRAGSGEGRAGNGTGSNHGRERSRRFGRATNDRVVNYGTRQNGVGERYTY